MIEQKNITCIVCPRGCMLSLSVDGDSVVISGYACAKGEVYGRQEAIEPLRSLTTTVRTLNPAVPRLPVRTDAELPLRLLLGAMDEINKITVDRAVRRGEVLLGNLLGLGVNVISCGDLDGSGRKDNE